jgi:hypothetical protein
MRKSTHDLVNLDQTGRWSVGVDVVAFVARSNASGHIGEIWRRMQGNG